MDLIQDATLGLNSVLTKRKKNHFPLENPGRKKTEEKFSSLLQSEKPKSDFCTNWPASAPNNSSTKAIFASKYRVCDLKCLHNGPFVMALTEYLSASVSFFFGPRIKSFLVFLLPCFPHFCHSYYFMKSDSWYSVSFQFPFQQSQSISSFPCQPLLSARHNVPKISQCQETSLKVHEIKFYIPLNF